MYFFSMRIYPHLQDTGGFFVAVIQRKRPKAKDVALKRKISDPEDLVSKKLKTNDEPVTSETESKITPIEAEEAVPPATLDENAVVPRSNSEPVEKFPVTGGTFKENPYTFLKPDDPFVQACM